MKGFGRLNAIESGEDFTGVVVGSEVYAAYLAGEEGVKAYIEGFEREFGKKCQVVFSYWMPNRSLWVYVDGEFLGGFKWGV
jgi:hypothetical protein